MRKYKQAVYIVVALFLTGCFFEPKKEDIFQKTIARVGNSGTLDGYYVVGTMSVDDTRGGGASFAYGAAHGYPSGSADIGGMSVPKYIRGDWMKYGPNKKTRAGFFHISAPIDFELAAKKIETLDHYYKSFERNGGVVQAVVHGPRVQLFYTKNCFNHRTDCSARENADPNGYVERSPTNSTDVVTLFDGIAEASPIPFANTTFDERIITTMDKFSGFIDDILIEDDQGNAKGQAGRIANPTHITAFWRTLGRDSEGKRNNDDTYYRLSVPLDSKITAEKIQALRQYYQNYFSRRGSVIAMVKGEDFELIYSTHCFPNVNNLSCLAKPGADPNHWVTYSENRESHIVSLYQGKGESSKTPFSDGPDYSQLPYRMAKKVKLMNSSMPK